jgi:hypothetical protein
MGCPDGLNRSVESGKSPLALAKVTLIGSELSGLFVVRKTLAQL